MIHDLTLLPLAKVHAAQKGLKYIFHRWNDIRKLPVGELALYKIACKVCGPYLSVGPGINHIGGHFGVDVKALTTNCVFCDIIRQCHTHFVGTNSSLNNCTVSYGRELDVQLCFAHRGDEYLLRSKDILTEHVHVQLYSKESENRRHPFRLSHDIFVDPKADNALFTLNVWMQECITSHQECEATTKQLSFVPTRLIKLEKHQTDTASLASPVQYVRYAALSYCWGINKQPKTTKKNVSTRYRQLSTLDLPQTLQDAILITRGLGLDYIWIDSICIVQDDEDEWAMEASKMADVYSGAHIVLAATRARDSAEGFLHPRSEPLVLQPKAPNPKAFKVNARRIDNHDCQLRTYLHDLPLFQRGWCLQERLLARRIIHFLPNELHFECQVNHRCECGALPEPDGEELFTRQFSEQQQPSSAFRSLMGIGSLEDDRSMWFGRVWGMVVRDYSALCLTYKKDTLPALSGIAQRVKQLDPGKYIAGIWEKDIAYQLGWHREMDRREATSPPPAEQESVLDKPAFSWITSPGPVKFHHDNRGMYTPLCTLVSGHTRRATGDRYGRVIDGSLCLHGKSVPGPKLLQKLHSTSMDIDWGTPTVYLDQGLSSHCATCCGPSGHYEGLDAVSDWSMVECFGLFFWSWWDNEHHFVDGLLLQRQVGDFKYVRIGMVSNLTRDWFMEEALERIVTIT